MIPAPNHGGRNSVTRGKTPVDQIVKMSTENPSKINAALRHFLDRRGFLIPFTGSFWWRKP